MSTAACMDHFEALRNRINARLEQIGTKHAHRQIRQFPWLYGALGEVPSDVMFVCENPSLTGVERADIRPLSGATPNIEDQWCGGPKSNCIKRFRPALCELGLKTTEPAALGGWRCYITNLIKEADVVRDFNARNKKQIALEWADLLRWEIEAVSPKVMFAVGSSAAKLVRTLQNTRQIQSIPTHGIIHYSARQSDIDVKAKMIEGIHAGMRLVSTTI